MVIEVKHFEGQKERPWYVIMNDDDRFSIEKFTSKQDAYEFYQIIKNNCIPLENRPTSRNSDSPEFSEYTNYYLSGYVKVVCKLNTWKNYKKIIANCLIPVWQGKTLDQINRTDVKNLILDLQTKGLSPATVENIKAITSGIFSYACEEEFIQVNPASQLSRFIKKKDKRKNGKFLTQDQITKFLKTAHQLFPNYYALFVCAFSTGMRLGEILALAWEDIDFDKNTIKVERSYSHGTIDTTKNGKVRFIGMSEHLHNILLKHREKIQSINGGILPEVNLSEKADSINTIHLVFPNRNGKPIDGANLKNRTFYKVIEMAELPHFRFHDIRHTFASMLLQQGKSLHYVKEQMGHASIQTTGIIYLTNPCR